MRQECIIQYHKLINRRTQNETGMYHTIPQAYQQKGIEGDRNVLYNTTSLSTEGHRRRQECIIQYHKLITQRLALQNTVSRFTEFKLETLLFGDKNLVKSAYKTNIYGQQSGIKT